MINIPARADALGLLLLALGVLAAVACALWARRRKLELVAVDGLAALALLTVIAAGPFLVWRVASDLRKTSAMTSQDLAGAGPVQAYLPPYLLDTVPKLIPVGDTYATIVGPRVPYAAARSAFPSLALQTLFPRISVAPAEADWIVSWGADPRGRNDVTRVVVARRAFGYSPPVFVAKVRRP